MINVNFRSKEEKKAAFKEKIKAKLCKGKDWLEANKEAVVTLTPIAIAGLTTIVKVVGKRKNLRKQEELKDLYCYDRSLGHYWTLRRELTNHEWLEIESRRMNGERLSNILASMRVLK